MPSLNSTGADLLLAVFVLGVIGLASLVVRSRSKRAPRPAWRSPAGHRLFRFEPRWKEEMVVTGPGGSFVLFMPMGAVSVCLPDAAAWPGTAPAWAADLWPALKDELQVWCAENSAELLIQDTAAVYPLAEG